MVFLFFDGSPRAWLLFLLFSNAYSRVLADDDAFLLMLPKPPACDKRRGRSTMVLEPARRICPADANTVSHALVLDPDEIMTLELRYTTVEGRRDANSNVRVVDAQGNTVASVNQLLLADNLSRSLVTIRGEPSVETCGHAQQVFVSTGTACVTYQLQATVERRLGFQNAGKLPDEAPTLMRGPGALNEFCGSLQAVANCDNSHWWRLNLETNDILLIHGILESNNGRQSVNSFLNLVSSDDLEQVVQRFFFVTVGGGRRRVTERYTFTGEAGTFFLQLGSGNLDQYEMAFQIVASEPNCQTSVDSDNRKAKLTFPTPTRCKKLKKLKKKNPLLVQNVCFDANSDAAESCPKTCKTCA